MTRTNPNPLAIEPVAERYSLVVDELTRLLSRTESLRDFEFFADEFSVSFYWPKMVIEITPCDVYLSWGDPMRCHRRWDIESIDLYEIVERAQYYSKVGTCLNN